MENCNRRYLGAVCPAIARASIRALQLVKTAAVGSSILRHRSACEAREVANSQLSRQTAGTRFPCRLKVQQPSTSLFASSIDLADVKATPASAHEGQLGFFFSRQSGLERSSSVCNSSHRKAHQDALLWVIAKSP